MSGCWWQCAPESKEHFGMMKECEGRWHVWQSTDICHTVFIKSSVRMELHFKTSWRFFICHAFGCNFPKDAVPLRLKVTLLELLVIFFLFALKVVPVRALWSSFVVRSSIVSGDNLLFLLLTIRSDINDFRNICKTPCVVWELLVSLRVLHHRFLSGVPGACIWWVGWIGHHNYHHD